MQLWQLLDKTDGQLHVLPDGDRLVVAGRVRDERDVELAQPLLEQRRRHVRVCRAAALPLVEPAFDTCHLFGEI